MRRSSSRFSSRSWRLLAASLPLWLAACQHNPLERLGYTLTAPPADAGSAAAPIGSAPDGHAP